MVLCFARRLVYPCCSDDNTVLLFQRPILRLVAQGQAWVAVFFILSGFVNALKPIKLARAGNVENALSNLALSSFRRSFRLVLPAAAATIISWAICQLGAYEVAKNSDAYWLYTYTPTPSDSWGTAIEDLVNGLRATWTLGIENPYDQPQWALLYLFQGSMMIFIALLITVNLTPFYRALTLIFFAFWSFDLSYKFRDRKLYFYPSSSLPSLRCGVLQLIHFYSPCRLHSLRWHTPRRIFHLSSTRSHFPLFTLARSTFGYRRFGPHVLPLRCP